jgi:hypothetical protein
MELADTNLDSSQPKEPSQGGLFSLKAIGMELSISESFRSIQLGKRKPFHGLQHLSFGRERCIAYGSMTPEERKIGTALNIVGLDDGIQNRVV